MGVDMKVKAIYDSEIGNITRSEKNWKDVLKVAGQLYRYEFDNIVMVTAQRPPEKSTLMADYDTWKKVGRYVKRGAKGCAIFPSRALNPRMRYIFDISDTGGKNVKLTWDLEGENLKDYVDFLVSEGQIEQYDNSDRESLKNILKQFTGTDVWLIIKEEFGDRMTELMQLSGSVIKEESKKRNGLQQEMDMEQLVYASVMYAVGTRCGFDLSVQEQDFSQIVNIKDEEIIYRLGSIVCDVSCSVLREFSRNLKAIESERRIGYVRRNDLQGSGRTALSADRDAGRDGGSHEAGQIRKDGDELSQRERAGKIQDADEIREDVREDVSGRGGSESAVRPVRDAVSGEAQATGSVIDNGDVEDKRAGEDAGRGSGTESDSDAIPLESDDTELNRELDEINSLGVSKEAEYTQASFFFDQNGQASIGTIHTEDENNNQFMRQFEQDRKAALAGKYNYLNPKKSATVPSEYIKQVLMRGTGFIGGKGRVCKIFETEIDAGTRAKRIKAEYGQGGAGWPVDGLGLHGYDTFHGNGLRFQWRDEDGEVEGYVSWKDIEKELGVLILTGEYQPETPRIDELAMDGLREDDEVIDAEYREVEPEEAESEIDDYAIPDEPESYASNRDYVSAKGMTPQETADEDRMVTQAEYGAEIEAETTEKDPSELQYITPIDYAKRIAELDEDLRDAAEILVTDCSCYTPFRAFLMDVVQSDFAFMPNKLDLIRDIALGTDNAERKAYSNNKYGLVEYSIRSGYVKISYKNRNGVRKEGALDWRELYEILSYMVKQPFYCGEDQKKYYQETKQKADRDKMNPVYKRFFDIEDSVKANRLETRERAIANGWETKIDENGHVVSDDVVSVSVDDIQADTESQETVDFTPKQEPVQQVESLENEKNVAGQTKHNFHYNLWEMEKGGPKTRYQWNMDAIRTLKQIESENRLATPEEQKVLSKFVGWGGLSQAFDEENAGWSKEYAELKDLLSDEEYGAARATVNNAFYTSPEIAMCMNSALVQFGFRGGNVLEPSMGIGNFFGSMPAPMQRSKLYGVELDSISGRIAKQLYQNANISITGFENTTYPDNFFDVVVGNVPFGDYKVFDPKYNKYNFRIHDYFMAKALDQVRPGGMVAVITTKGTLDKANPIGSTDKCGTGVNVQTHLVAMHHVDCPWKPSSIEQREGRGIRQGNENEEVAIYRYVTKGTFDAYNWSLVENKQRFISQVMTSKAVSRSCEDIDEATLSYAEIKAVATGNPLIREKMEIDNDVQRLKLLKASYDNQRYGLQDNFMIKYPKLIKTATEKLANVREDVKARDKELIDNPEFSITIGKAAYTERVDGGTMMLEAISKCKTGETTAIGKFHGFELLVEKNFLGINYMVLRGKTEYKAELSTSPVGSMVKLENLFNGLHENIDFLEKKIEQYQNDLEASKAEYDKPFAYSKELEEKLSRQCELNAQLDLENAKAVDADLSGPEEEREADDRMESAAIVAEDKGAYPADREGRTR